MKKVKQPLANFKKVSICAAICTATVCVLSYEAVSIMKKEYERQTEIAKSIHTNVNFNLDMLKIAIQTSDTESYFKYLIDTNNNLDSVTSLFLIQDQEAPYTALLKQYINTLSDRTTLLSEISLLKEDVQNLSTIFKDNYSDKNSITRDKLTGVSTEIIKHKLDTTKYTEEKIIAIVNSVNTIIDNIADKAKALTNCIDACYANRIGEIADGLAEQIKNFATQTEQLNQDLENQFDFESMDKLRS